MDEQELKFPVVAHYRLIIDVAKRDDAAIAAALAGFELGGPATAGRVSANGKYLSYALSARLHDRAEMARLDAAIATIPGLKMCL